MNIPKLKHLNSNNFILIAGPCAIESEEMAFKIAEKILNISNEYKVPFIFKGSFKKANRSRIDSFTGIGDIKALEILNKVSSTLDIPTITDIHEVKDADLAAKYVDVLQIPAFLVRQTDLVVAAAKTGKTVNLKKGQFMSPESMQYAVQKVKDSNNTNVFITDRGTMFGYHDMIVDFRGIPTMKSIAPTILDVTHSLQKPNQTSGVTGGVPEMIETIARAGVVNNIDGLFIETHFDPKNAKSDGANMLDLSQLENLVSNLVEIRKTINKF
ncbi:3-deoxy-8-phosphooctulonate synthase [Flavobacteriaceae bacterium]|jgi:2-dehydro-3-deoxyphosphooctonate aldolase (KDO 8-P synthase)|nr:3-deoxy-8-phosphooctulonate synthase [Flavobacteriaceae bacterium]MDB2355050.1 3-deoxy-8-phosphooctulonate synthase [Flavobacteriaceae bacterium]MDC1371772.1 3-deoxy-8-phosphooctulonate synthase [Flavobacteriaceae bacterium]|tara:strand:+ start:72 stop:881 length:810 start_codon:yes stop_codon:yes gene_type:complete